MRLIVQPEDGIALLLKAINKAVHSVEIVVFRFDHREIERALSNAVARGVAVSALIAHTNRAGEQNLRKLEMRLLASGVNVARTADDLVRYHGKLMLVDHRDLYLLAFNWTYLDIEASRSFGIITRNPVVVKEAERLFDADSKRHPYEPGSGKLVVSPVNARKTLTDFLKAAKKSLSIYDPKVSDPRMLSLLEERSRAGVEIKIIGRVTRRIPGVEVSELASLRLHTRMIIRDRELAFIGSQSLRAVELDGRREVGLIFRDRKIMERLLRTFADDWAKAQEAIEQPEPEVAAIKIAKRVAKMVTREMPEVVPVLNGAVKGIAGDTLDIELNPEQVEEVVKGAVKEAVREAVSEMVQEVVQHREQGGGK